MAPWPRDPTTMRSAWNEVASSTIADADRPRRRKHWTFRPGRRSVSSARSSASRRYRASAAASVSTEWPIGPPKLAKDVERTSVEVRWTETTRTIESGGRGRLDTSWVARSLETEPSTASRMRIGNLRSRSSSSPDPRRVTAEWPAIPPDRPVSGETFSHAADPLDEALEERRRVRLDDEVHVRRPAPQPPEVGDRLAVAKAARRVDVHGDGLGPDERRVQRHRDHERVVDERAVEPVVAGMELEVEAERVGDEPDDRVAG